MLTTKKIESDIDALSASDLVRHELEGPELVLEQTFHPYGFPVAVHTNSAGVLTHYAEMWGMFGKQHNTAPMRADVQVLTGGDAECPPEPRYRIMLPFLHCVADRDNHNVVDLEHCHTTIAITEAALRHRLYAQYFLLGAPAACIATRYTTPVHAGCVALHGRGVLLCGDSGAGKSTLSYACARAGWTYVTDDASYLENGGSARMVTGNCYQVRFRPTAAALFPELDGLEITPRAAGKPSIELPTEPMTHIHRAQSAHVDFIVYLNRDWSGAPQLVRYSKDAALQSMRQVLYGPVAVLLDQYRAIGRLLAAEVFELRYSSLDWAIARLQELVGEGR